MIEWRDSHNVHPAIRDRSGQIERCITRGDDAHVASLGLHIFSPIMAIDWGSAGGLSTLLPTTTINAGER
ncbi:hypothetical protein ZHAS_00019121 [Anopheles sinensis]|uniref:Uncharacterized protein n=1 Tax=Anopheles sinensis TaxID=74873 RepID=A0A084WLH3_ANOSI|nr:hypothetical protein ZHAS_00019121 [Anopheles sinensis]